MKALLFLAGVVAVVLKLAGVEPVADWSWLLVTAPFWALFALALVILVIALIASTVAAGVAAGSLAVHQHATKGATNRPALRRVGK